MVDDVKALTSDLIIPHTAKTTAKTTPLASQPGGAKRVTSSSALPLSPEPATQPTAAETTALALPLPDVVEPAVCEHGCGHLVEGSMRRVHDRSRGVGGACVSPERMQQAAKAAAHVARLKRGFATLAALQVHLQSGGRAGDFPIHETVYVDDELQSPWIADGAAGPAAPLCLQRINRITGTAEWNTRLGVSGDPTGTSASIQMYARGEAIADSAILVRLAPQATEPMYQPARPTAAGPWPRRLPFLHPSLSR